ncbi:unnamed protein product [Penicillium nalgiovense]|nr:unnamed protein product [Penicillium nalgiovense]
MPLSQRRFTTHAESEQHYESGPVIRDIVIGFADGMTVPFALTAGLSSLGSSKLVIIGGLAELFSGSISMGLGAYLAAVTDRDHYKSEEERERAEIFSQPTAEQEEIHEILFQYGISREASQAVVDCLTQNNEHWIRFMMDFELRLEKPNRSRAWISAATMGVAYFIGGLLPMIPYFAIHDVLYALYVSIGITVVTLFSFGFIKNFFVIKTKRAGFYGAVQTLLIGTIAAATSYGIVYGVDHSNIHT